MTHLKNNPRVRRTIGLKSVPHRKTIARWRLLSIVIRNSGNTIQELVLNKLVISDSAPILDKNDPDAKKGANSRGFFENQ